MKYFSPLVPFVFGWMVLLSSATLTGIALVNGLAQLVLFGLVVCLPIWKTGRMSYVDIGWPLGLVVIGILSYLLGDGYSLRSWLVG